MKKVVCHFIRKSSQLRASFIQNQILNHIDYEPVIVYKYHSNKFDGGFAEFDNYSIPVLNLWNESGLFSRLLFKYFKKISRKDVIKIKMFLKKHNVSILHFHYGTDAGVYHPFLKKNTIPSVVSFYGYECSGFPKRFFGIGKYYLRHRVFPFMYRVFAMSPDMKKDLLNIGCPESKIEVHYYGTDVERFNINNNYSDGEITKYLIISGLVPQKGHIFLIESFKLAYKKNNKIELYIYGDGDLKEKILKLVDDYNINYIKYMGKVTYGSNNHLQLLKDADVFIHPSVTDTNGDKEGIPGAIVEAMAAGLPVISTYHAGIPYVIEDKVTGLLVKEWDYEALSESILLLANNQELRRKIGENAKKYALNFLNLQHKEKELENIYKLLNDTNSSSY